MLKKRIAKRSQSSSRPNGRPTLKEVRTAWLVKPKEDSKSSKGISDFLSKPISLWFLSSVALGLAGYLYGNFTTCRTAQIADDLAIHRQLNEVVGRAVDLSLALTRGGLNSQKSIDDVKGTLDPNVTFVFLENKGRGNSELSSAIDYTLRRWDESYPILTVMHSVYPPFNVDPLEDYQARYGLLLEERKPIDNAMRMNYLETFFRYFHSAIYYVNMAINNNNDDAQKHKEEASKNIKLAQSAASVVQAIFLGEIFHSNYCVKRSVWPF